jgi:hypothetical protein
MWYARTQLELGRVAVNLTDEAARAKLQEDLLTPRYRIAQERTIEVEPKDSAGAGRTWGLRNRLGRSTDDGDAFCIALFVEHLAEREDSDEIEEPDEMGVFAF